MTCLTYEEHRLITLVNAFRVEQGVPALRPSEVLTRAARAYADFIAVNDYWPDNPHTGPDGSTPTSRAQALGYSGVVGENLLWGQLNADRCSVAWRNSPPHRENMLSPRYTEIGVALAVEPTWDYANDVYLVAAMSLGIGQSEPVELCQPSTVAAEPRPQPPPAPAPMPVKPRPDRRQRRRLQRLMRRIFGR